MSVTLTFLGRGIGLTSKQVNFQSPGETVNYKLDVSKFVSSINGTPSISKSVDIEDPDVDLKSTHFPAGSVSVSTTTITLKDMTALTLGKTYRVHVTFVDGTDTSETYEVNFLVKCKY